MKRRHLIKGLALGAAAAASGGSIMAAGHKADEAEAKLKGNINHSVCSWTYDFMPLEELCSTIKKIGFHAIDLLAPKDWPLIQKNGIYCSMCYTAGKISLTEGWNDPKNHAWLIKDFTDAIPLVAAAGYKNLICFSGNRNGMDDETGMKN